jgi:hypothetical protein
MLLDENPFVLAPGEVPPVAVMQPFAVNQEVVITTRPAPEAAHCLSVLAANVGRVGSELRAVVPAATAWDWINVIEMAQAPLPVCYPCATVCACGTR